MDDKRSTLINRMNSAKSEEEITRAQREAHWWLLQNPGDADVAVTKQKLDERSEKLDNPEYTANKITWIALIVAVPLAFLASLLFSSNWGIAATFGVCAGIGIAACMWEFVGVLRVGIHRGVRRS